MVATTDPALLTAISYTVVVRVEDHKEVRHKQDEHTPHNTVDESAPRVARTAPAAAFIYVDTIADTPARPPAARKHHCHPATLYTPPVAVLTCCAHVANTLPVTKA